MKSNRADAAIVGAGVIGCAIARELASRGMRVIVLDAGVPGREASWAAAGMLSPLGEAGAGGPFLDLSEESLRMYAPFADALRRETGIDIEYRTPGRLHVSLGDADEELQTIAAAPASQRFDVSLLDGSAARRMEPALADTVTAALLVGRDHRVNNRLLAQALRASAVAAGADIRSHRRVAAVGIRGDAVSGITLASGERIHAEHVIIAAGAWSGDIDGIPRILPVRPVRGQMFAVDARHADDRISDASERHVVYARSCYIIPRDDGRLLVGATVEDTGFDAGPTPRGIAGLIAAATAVMPFIGSLPLVETWAGFRPGTPDGLPVIGVDPIVRGLIYATGHFRNGILLTPVTAACVAALVIGEPSPLPLDPFAISRFTGHT